MNLNFVAVSIFGVFSTVGTALLGSVPSVVSASIDWGQGPGDTIGHPLLIRSGPQKENMYGLNFEVPPSMYSGGWRTYVTSNAASVAWATPYNMGDLSVNEWDLTNPSFQWSGPYPTHRSDMRWPDTGNEIFVRSDPYWITPSTAFYPAYQDQLGNWIYASGWPNYIPTNPYIPGTLFPQHYGRHHNAVFQTHLISSYPRWILSVVHGEDHNHSAEGYYYQNLVHPSMVVDPNNINTYHVSAINTNGYAAFVHITMGLSTSQTNWGLTSEHSSRGPVAWPNRGYRKTLNGVTTKVGNGPRHPSSIVHNGYIYIYYHDGSGIAGETGALIEGRNFGIKVCRVKISDILAGSKTMAEMSQVYYKGNWIAALPSGLTIENMLDYVETQGGKSSNIIGSDTLHDNSSLRFSVAKFPDRNLFLGVRQYQFFPGFDVWNLQFYLSSDLVNWISASALNQSLQTSGIMGSWSNFKYSYPLFLDLSGWSNHRLSKNMDGSYSVLVLGTPHPVWDPLDEDFGQTVNRMKVNITLSE